MEGHCSTGQIQQWAVVPMEEEEVHPTAVPSNTTQQMCVLFTPSNKNKLILGNLDTLNLSVTFKFRTVHPL